MTARPATTPPEAKPSRGLASGKWLPWAVGTGGGLAALVMIWVVLIGPLGLRGTKLDATARLEGWREVAGAVAEIRAARAAQTGVLPWILVVGNRATVCELAFYLPDQPRVYRFPSEGHPESQYELWPNPAQDGLAKDEALVLVRDGGDLPPEVRACFSHVTEAGDLRVPVGTRGRAHVYTLWRAQGYTPPAPEGETGA